jgi:hypothetical protein
MDLQSFSARGAWVARHRRAAQAFVVALSSRREVDVVTDMPLAIGQDSTSCVLRLSREKLQFRHNISRHKACPSAESWRGHMSATRARRTAVAKTPYLLRSSNSHGRNCCLSTTAMSYSTSSSTSSASPSGKASSEDGEDNTMERSFKNMFPPEKVQVQV